MIFCRSTHSDSACLTFGSSSSRFFVLSRVGVPRDVGGLGARHDVQVQVRLLLDVVDRLERHLVDPLQRALLEVGDHRVRVRVELEHDGVGVRRGAVVVRVRPEHDLALLLVALDRVGAAGDERVQVLLRCVGLEPGAVAADQRLPLVLGHDEQRLQLLKRVAHRPVVVNHERRRVGRLGVLDVRHGGGRHRRRPVLVLDDRVDRPRRVLGGHRLAVRPLGVRLELERPVLAVGRGRPRIGPVADDDQLVRVALRLAVLHQLRIDHDHGVVRLRLDVVEGIERVDVVGRADGQDAALVGAASGFAAAAARRPAAAAGGHDEHGRRCGQAQEPPSSHVCPSLCRSAVEALSS